VLGLASKGGHIHVVRYVVPSRRSCWHRSRCWFKASTPLK
jgi:hypothetical protein